jgi:predicted aspartyl protease
MLSGRFTRFGSPAITGELQIPNLSVAGEVTFLIDTGASNVVLMPRDVEKLGVPIDKLEEKKDIEGTTGTAKAFVRTAFIVFRSETYAYTYTVQLVIIEPTIENSGRGPSLLGREIVNKWCFLYDARAGTLDIDPTSWHRREALRL